MLKRLLSIALVSACATTFVVGEEKGEGHEKHHGDKIELADAPAAVQAAIKVAGGTLKELDKVKHGDKTVYVAHVTEADGKTKELKLDEAGKPVAGREKGEAEKGEHGKDGGDKK